MKNILPIVIGAVIIVAAIGVVLQSNQKHEQAEKSVQQVETTPSVQNTPAVSGVTPTSQPLASGITLSISTPANNSTVTTPALTVKGKSVPKAEVFVNDEETKADSSGNFSATLTLDEGENYILVVANDDIGNYSEKELYITYSP